MRWTNLWRKIKSWETAYFHLVAHAIVRENLNIFHVTSNYFSASLITCRADAAVMSHLWEYVITEEAMIAG